MSKDEARNHLDGLKAACREACDDHSAAIAEAGTDAMFRASVAHHVRSHGDDSVGVAQGNGRPLIGEAGSFTGSFVDPRFIAETSRVAIAAARGEDPAAAAGADPAHVALLEAAQAAHADHAEALAAAYADFAAAD